MFFEKIITYSKIHFSNEDNSIVCLVFRIEKRKILHAFDFQEKITT